MEDLFNYPKSQRTTGQIQTSVLISKEFYELAKKYNIKFSEALRVGLSLLFAEAGEMDYDNNLNLYRKMIFFKTELERMSQELESLKKKHDELN